MLGSAIRRPSARTTHSFFKQRTRRYSELPTSASLSSSSPRSTLKNRHWEAFAGQNERPTILTENKCAKVRTWDILRGPAEALALIRAVEHKYGPVESFYFIKDFDRPDLYQNLVRINFRDVESFLRVPEGTETIHIRGPKVQARRPGGIGLDEIQSLISGTPEFLTADQVSEMSPEERSIDFRINRSVTAPSKMSPYPRRYPLKSVRMGFQMLEWGGFYKMKPIDSTRPITNEELTKEKLDHVHMRVVLRDWAKFLNKRNPYEVYPEEPTKDDGQILASDSSLDEKEGTVEEPSSMLDEWSTSDVSKPNPKRDPFKEILDMEDINLTETKVDPVGATNVKTSDPQSVSTSQSREPQHEQEPLLNPLSAAQSPPQSDSPAFTPEVEVPERRPKQPKREADGARQAQLLEAKRLGDLVRSRGQPKGKQSPKTKFTNRAKKPTPTRKVADKQDVEPQTHFGKLFSKIQNLFRGS